MIGALLALAVLGAIGFAVIAAAARGGVPRSLAADLPRAFAIGAAVLAAYGMGTVALGARLSLLPPYLFLALAAAVACFRGTGRVYGVRLPRRAGARLLLGGAAAAVCTVALAALQDRLWWDGWAMWALKARVLFLDSTLPPAFFDVGAPWAITNLDYPLLVPLVGWWLYSHAGAADPMLASLAGAAWFALLPVLMWVGLRRRTHETVAAAGALGVAVFWPVAYFATGGTADVVVAVALLGAVVELDRGLRSRRAEGIWFAAAFLTAGALAKNEGIALAAIGATVAAGMLVHAGERRVTRFLPLLLPFAAVAPWRIFIRSLEIGSPALAWSEAAEPALDRAALLLEGLGILFTQLPWLPVLPLAAVGLVAALSRPGAWPLRACWAVVLAYAGAIAVVYVRAPADMLWLLGSSAPRVFGAMVPVLVLLSLVSALPRHDGLASRR